MDLQTLVVDINEKLQNGLSTAKIEKDLGYGKDTLRKKLNRAGYNYDKGLKKYVTHDNTLGDKVVTHINTRSDKVVTHINTRSDEKITQKNTISYKDIDKASGNKTKEIIKPTEQFTSDEMRILKKMINEYKLQQNIREINIDNLKDKTITTRSFRSYKEIMDNFAKYCKDNNLSQVESISIALTDFINK